MSKIRKRSFTLVEIMIVVAIISALAAIAIPFLLRVRLNTNESAAVSAIKTLSSSAVSYRAVNNSYPAILASLSNANPPYIDAVLGNGAKQGYDFSLTGSTNIFTATGRPQDFGTSGVRSFFVDESGVVRYCNISGCNLDSTSSTLE